MRSATDFLPWLISTLTNFATSLLEYLGSGRISRLGISRRRGMSLYLSLIFMQGFKQLWVSWHHTSNGPACDLLRPLFPGCRAPCGSAHPADLSLFRLGPGPPSAPAGC